MRIDITWSQYWISIITKLYLQWYHMSQIWYISQYNCVGLPSVKYCCFLDFQNNLLVFLLLPRWISGLMFPRMFGGLIQHIRITWTTKYHMNWLHLYNITTRWIRTDIMICYRDYNACIWKTGPVHTYPRNIWSMNLKLTYLLNIINTNCLVSLMLSVGWRQRRD